MSLIDHIDELQRALAELDREVDRIADWGRRLAGILVGGGRLLAAGNGGSAAQAQHLTAELVGRYLGERAPLSAIALHADTSALTAISNDYGNDECFARQVHAHGRRGDALVALSTSGRSPNIVRAAEAAHRCGMTVFSLTGPVPNRLSSESDGVIAVDGATPTVQEVHQVIVHMLCEAIDEEVLR
jgi:D-sedoheptulose 7-phosphate isomerase